MSFRIDTEHTREVGRRLVSEGDRMAEIGHELRSAIRRLDTGAWDGRSRCQAEPLLDRVRPESTRVAEALDELGRKLLHVADTFQQEDNSAAANLAGMGWVDWRTAGSSSLLGLIGAIIKPVWPLPVPPPWHWWRRFPWPPRYWPIIRLLPLLPIVPPIFRFPWNQPRPGFIGPTPVLPTHIPKLEPEPSPQPVPGDAEDSDGSSNGGESSKPPGHASPPRQPAPDTPKGTRRVEVNEDARTGDCVDFVEDNRDVPSGISTWQNGGVDDTWDYGPVPEPGAIMVEGYDADIGIGAEINGTKWGHVSYVDWVEYDDAGNPARFHIVEGGWNGGKHEQTFDWPIGDSSRRHPHRFICDKKE